MKTGRELGNKPLVSRTIHCTGLVVARSTQVGYRVGVMPPLGREGTCVMVLAAARFHLHQPPASL